MQPAVIHKKKQQQREELSQQGVVYEDDFCKLGDKGLEIKTYYFPLATSKLIPYDKIKLVIKVNELTAANDSWPFCHKQWGQGVGDIW